MGKFITITSTGAGGSTPIGINGRSRTLPHNREVAVSDAELSALRNSHVSFTEGDDTADPAEAVDNLEGNDADDAPAGATDATGTVAGADHLTTATPALTGLAVTVAPTTDDTPAGADHLTTTQPGDEAAAVERARAQQEASASGQQEPVIELTNTDLNQTGTNQQEGTAVQSEAQGGEQAEGETFQPDPGANPDAAETQQGSDSTPPGTLNVEPFDAEATLDQSIENITQDMDEFTDAQVQQLLDAERRGKNRSTLIEKLERRLASA